VGLFGGELAGDGGAASADAVLDDRGGVDRTVQNDGQTLLDVAPVTSSKKRAPRA
jgi:hypothetical protein